MNKTKDNKGAISERGVGKKKIPGHIVINKEKSSKGKWYVVHTTSGHEARVAETLRQRVETMNLEERIFEILVPTQDRVVIRGGKKATVKEKIFPGYMLVKMILDDPTWLAVRTTPGVTGFVGPSSQPVPLDKKEVSGVEYRMGLLEKKPKPGVVFEQGETVRISQGPFANFQGEIIEVNANQQRLKVLVSIFSRETPVEIEYVNVEKL